MRIKSTIRIRLTSKNTGDYFPRLALGGAKVSWLQLVRQTNGFFMNEAKFFRIRMTVLCVPQITLSLEIDVDFPMMDVLLW